MFERWPTWMWANDEVVDFCRWLRHWNAGWDERRRVGFHGLDVYSLWELMRAILVYLREHRPGDEEPALRAYRCFEPYAEDPQEYALALRFVPGVTGPRWWGCWPGCGSGPFATASASSPPGSRPR
jgi:erythromycin esterase